MKTDIEWNEHNDVYIQPELIRAIQQDALETAAQLHDSINPANDNERTTHTPGAGAMGAIIEYRDKIRALKPQ